MARNQKSRDRWYYVITMPVTADGQGPADLKDAAKLLYEVWDQTTATHGSHESLADAIDQCEELNAQHDWVATAPTPQKGVDGE